MGRCDKEKQHDGTVMLRYVGLSEVRGYGAIRQGWRCRNSMGGGYEIAWEEIGGGTAGVEMQK